MDQGELHEKDENVLFKETIFICFKMPSFAPFELLEAQGFFQLYETRPPSVQMALKIKCLSNISL